MKKMLVVMLTIIDAGCAQFVSIFTSKRPKRSRQLVHQIVAVDGPQGPR